MTFALGILPVVLLLLGFPVFLVLLSAAPVALVFYMHMPLAALHQNLFGSINAIDGGDLRTLLVVAAIVLTASVVLHRALVVGTFDPTQAALIGFRPRLTHFALLVLLALAIVASFETVGSLLVFAFLVAPPATATLLVRRVPSIMLLAVGVGAASAIVGLLISYHHATATGATMALVTVVVFLAALALDALRRTVR